MERLVRYWARPPFALQRLRVERDIERHDGSRPDGEAVIGQILYRPVGPTRDVCSVHTLSPLEFLAANSRLIPPPRVPAGAAAGDRLAIP